jgi:hypothetical protein
MMKRKKKKRRGGRKKKGEISPPKLNSWIHHREGKPAFRLEKKGV